MVLCGSHYFFKASVTRPRQHPVKAPTKPLKALAADVNAPISTQPRKRRPLRRAQLSDEVAGHLRAAIMSGTLRPGTFIRLDETADHLGANITAGRAALLQLPGVGMCPIGSRTAAMSCGR